MSPEVVAALERLQRSGRRLILVTGRRLDDLLGVVPEIGTFDRVVAENGAVLFNPATQRQRRLAEAPPLDFDRRLAEKGVPCVRGLVIVATHQPYETRVLDTIRELGLELQVTFNRDAVMILPSGVNKATGLAHALSDLRLSPHNTVAVGDAENDHALLAFAECAVAVGNAVSALKARADWVTEGNEGEGVRELMEALLASDLAAVTPRLFRHRVRLGTRPDGSPLTVSPCTENVLVVGAPASGKSTFGAAFAEGLAGQGYQFCRVDPDGSHEGGSLTSVLGDAKRPPHVAEVLELLDAPAQSVTVNLVSVPDRERPPFLASLLARLREMRARFGRPHWIIVESADAILSPAWSEAALPPPADLPSMLLIAADPQPVAPEVLSTAHRLIAFGARPSEAIAMYAARLGLAAPVRSAGDLAAGEAVTWAPTSPEPPFRFRMLLPRTSHKPRE